MLETTATILTGFLAFGPGFAFRKSGRSAGPVTAIEFDGDVLRLVQSSQRGGRTVISRIATARLELSSDVLRSDPVAVGAAIQKALAGLRIRPGAVAIGVPRASVILRTVLVPDIKDVNELASIVHFQIGKDLPFRLDEAVIDFKICRRIDPALRADSNGKASGSAGAEPNRVEAATPAARLEVLVAAVKRDIVAFYERVATAAGMKLVALGWSSYANARFLEECRLTSGNEAVALVSLRPDEVGIDIVAGESLLFSRGAAIQWPHETANAETQPNASAETKTDLAGGPEPASASQSFVEKITIEVVRSLHGYGGMESNSPVAKLVVAGATGHEAAVVEALKNRLSISCESLDPRAAIRLPEGAADEAASCTSTLGLAFGVNDPQGLPFDFLNPKQPAVPRDTRRLKIIAATAVGALLLVVLLGVRAHFVNARLKIYRQVQNELTDAEKKRPIYRQMRQQAATIRDWLKEGRNNLEHYANLSAVLPGSEEIYATSVAMSGQGGIRMSVQARSSEVLAKMDKQLRAAGYDLKPLAITPGPDKFGYNFRTSVELTAPDKIKIDLAKLAPPARLPDDASLDAAKRPSQEGRSK